MSDKMVAGDTVYNPVRLLSSSLPPCSLESLSHRAHGGKRYLKASTCRHNVVSPGNFALKAHRCSCTP